MFTSDVVGKIPSLPSFPSMETGIARPSIMEPPKIATDDQKQTEIYVHMLDSQLPYGYEFYGCDVSLALTPVTERCFLSLTQVKQWFVCKTIDALGHLCHEQLRDCVLS